MRIIIVGAYGLLGGYVTTRLLADGHSVVGVGRDIVVAKRRFPAARWVQADLRTTGQAEWAALLRNVDAVVNCAGALQDSPRDDLHAVHVKAVTDLAAACQAAGVRRFIQISAVGVERGAGQFQRTKQAADEVLQAADLDWIILRPGLVLAPAAYGGSALLRGLAAFPIFIPALFPESTVQIVSVEDVAEAVARSLQAKETRFVCDVVAAEQTRLADVLLAMRGWLGMSSAKLVAAPRWLGALSAVIADGLGLLGWRSPMRTAALEQLAAGVTGHAEDTPARLGFMPRGLAEALMRWPTGVHERWFARLYFLKPLALATLAVFWATSGVIGLMNRSGAVSILVKAGVASRTAFALVVAGSLIDVTLAGLACRRGTARLALRAMVLVTVIYLAGATLWLPQLWVDPLGPLVKSIPAAVLALVALAILEER